MEAPRFLDAVRAYLERSVPGLGAWARRAWCREQRRRLRDRAVVWVHEGEKVPWARWGADHGFFEVEWAGHLPYLRRVAVAE